MGFSLASPRSVTELQEASSRPYTAAIFAALSVAGRIRLRRRRPIGNRVLRCLASQPRTRCAREEESRARAAPVVRWPRWRRLEGYELADGGHKAAAEPLRPVGGEPTPYFYRRPGPSPLKRNGIHFSRS